MLERLYVDNYRCFVNFECRFGAKQLILGGNGAGKSSLLDVLALLRDFSVRGRVEERALAGTTRTRWQSVPEQRFELDVAGNGGRYAYRLVVDEIAARVRIVKEEVDFDGKPVFRFDMGEVHLFNDRHEDKVQYPFDWHRSALATITERKDNTKLSWFKRWLGGVLCLQPDPRRMSALAQKEIAYPDSDLGNFADWYRHLRLESGDRELLDDLQQAIEGFARMDLKDAGLGNRVLKVWLSSEEESGTADSEDAYDFRELSDGQRVLIGLYTALHFGLLPGATIAFDEPDNFVALREILPWLGRVLDRVEEGPAQVLVVSHHPELMNRMAFGEGLYLERPGRRQTRVRKFDDAVDTGLSPAELVLRGWER